MDQEHVSRDQLLEKIRDLDMLNRQLLREKEEETRLEYAWTGNLGHWYWNVKTNEVTFNPLKVTTLGFDKSEIPPRVSYQYFTDMLHPEDYQKAMDAMLGHMYRDAGVYEVEYRIRAKDGSYRWYYDRGKAVVVFWLLCAALFQIWSHRARMDRLNKRLALGEALYRKAFEQAPISVAIVEDKRFISQADFSRFTITPMFQCILGRSTEELVKVSWTEIMHPDDLQEDLLQFERFTSGQINGYSMEKRFVKPDGTAVWASMSISPLIGVHEDHSLHLCLIEDITGRREAALALKENERREAVLLSHLPGLAYRCRYDRDGTMLIVSEGCFPLTGYPPEVFIHIRDLSFNDIISPEGRQL